MTDDKKNVEVHVHYEIPDTVKMLLVISIALSVLFMIMVAIIMST
jgi:hypothetical protein